MSEGKYSFMNYSNEETKSKKKRFHANFGGGGSSSKKKRFFTGKTQKSTDLDEDERRFLIGQRGEDGDRPAAEDPDGAPDPERYERNVPWTTRLWDRVKFVMVDLLFRLVETGIATVAHEIFLFFGQRRLLPSHVYGGAYA